MKSNPINFDQKRNPFIFAENHRAQASSKIEPARKSKTTPGMKRLKAEASLQENVQSLLPAGSDCFREENTIFIEQVKNQLLSNPSELYLASQNIDDKKIHLLSLMLPASQVESLYLSGNDFTNIGMHKLILALSRTNIKLLDIRDCKNQNGLLDLADYLPFTKIEILRISSKDLKETELNQLQELLSRSAQLKFYDL